MKLDDWRRQLSSDEDELAQMFGIYFGEDWLDDYGEPWTNVLDAFVTDSEAEATQAALAELDALLASRFSDGDLDWLLRDGLHVAMDRTRLGFSSAIAWLEAVRDELRRRTTQEV
jgi:hypothetical protein